MLRVQAASGIRASSAGRSSRQSLVSCPPHPPPRTSPAYHRLTLSALRRVAPLWRPSELLTWPQVVSWRVPSFYDE